MPNINDDNTVQAIAQAYCTNGYNEEQGLISAGYSDSYARGGTGHKLYADVRVLEAIDRIMADSAGKVALTVDTVLQDLDWGISIARQRKDLAAIARLSELRGKHLSMFSEAGNNAATGLNLNFTSAPRARSGAKGAETAQDATKANTGTNGGLDAKTA